MDKGKRPVPDQLELDERWRILDRELDDFQTTVEKGSERETKLTERCRELPFHVSTILVIYCHRC